MSNNDRFILTGDGRMYRDTLTNQDFSSPTPADTIWDSRDLQDAEAEIKHLKSIIRQLEEKIEFLLKHW